MTSIESIDSLAITDKASDYVWPDAECPSAFQPAKPLRFSLAARPRPALQVNPERLTVDHLDINVPPAYFCVIENHVRPRITADNRTRLIQQPQFALARALALNDELEGIRESTSIQE
jgi:hypothetical protein